MLFICLVVLQTALLYLFLERCCNFLHWLYHAKHEFCKTTLIKVTAKSLTLNIVNVIDTRFYSIMLFRSGTFQHFRNANCKAWEIIFSLIGLIVFSLPSAERRKKNPDRKCLFLSCWRFHSGFEQVSVPSTTHCLPAWCNMDLSLCHCHVCCLYDIKDLWKNCFQIGAVNF